MNQLEQEAEEFLKKRTPTEEPDVESFRFYLGIALSGYLSEGYNTRPEEVLNKAAELAVLAQQKEKEYLG